MKKIVSLISVLLLSFCFAGDLGVVKDFYDEYISIRPNQIKEYGIRVSNMQDFPINLTIETTNEEVSLYGEQYYILEPNEKVSLKLLINPKEVKEELIEVTIKCIGKPLTNIELDENAMARFVTNKNINLKYKIEGEPLTDNEIREQEEELKKLEETEIIEDINLTEDNLTEDNIEGNEEEIYTIQEQEDEEDNLKYLLGIPIGLGLIGGGVFVYNKKKKPKEYTEETKIEKPKMEETQIEKQDIYKEEPTIKPVEPNNYQSKAELLKKLKGELNE